MKHYIALIALLSIVDGGVVKPWVGESNSVQVYDEENTRCKDPRAPCSCVDKMSNIQGVDIKEHICDHRLDYVPKGFSCQQQFGYRYTPSKNLPSEMIFFKNGCELRYAVIDKKQDSFL